MRPGTTRSSTSRSVTDSQSYCQQHVVALGNTYGVMPKSAKKGETGLVTDLKSAKTTPAYSFISPNLCRDGHDYPCKNQTGASSALANIGVFLKAWVPKIQASRGLQGRRADRDHLRRVGRRRSLTRPPAAAR